MATSRSRFPIRRRSIGGAELVLGGLVALGGLIAIVVLRWPAKAPPPSVAPPAPIVVAPVAPRPPPEPPPEILTRPTLTVRASTPVGTPISVRWTGPENPDDFVTLVKSDAPDAEVGSKQPTRSGHVLEFTAPEEPGKYDLRYVTGRSKRVLGRAVVTVLPLSAEIFAPGQAVLGTKIAVTWKGPNRPGDYLTIVDPEVSAGVTDGITPVAGGSPVEMNAPVDPGEFEIRYMTKDGSIIGRRTVLVTIPVTTLSAPDQVSAGDSFEVRWRGPDSPMDMVTLVPRGVSDRFKGVSTQTAEGSPLTIVAPPSAGEMELRYVAGSKGQVFARRRIVVQAKP